jgi:hypothetical protein
VIVSVGTFAVHAVVTGGLLSIACGILSGRAWITYKPGWFGLGLSTLILAVFYSQQIKTLGLRPLIVLPALVGGALALLCSTNPNIEPEQNVARNSERWRCAATTLLIPLTASLGYAFQMFSHMRGIPLSWIFNGLALVGGAFFLAACGAVVRKSSIRSSGKDA